MGEHGGTTPETNDLAERVGGTNAPPLGFAAMNDKGYYHIWGEAESQLSAIPAI